jgi:alpha-L-fucosidase
MRERNWFFSERDEHTVKFLDELMGIYYYSCGGGCNMPLGIGPDRRGLLPGADAARLVESGGEVSRRLSAPFARLPDFARRGNRWEFSSEEVFMLDRLVAAEDTSKGESVGRFAVSAEMPAVSGPVTVFEGRAICPFPAIRTRELIFEVLESGGEFALERLELHNAGGRLPVRRRTGARPREAR